MKMIDLERKGLKAKCTACGACVAICHKNAIVMKQNSEGFCYPIVTKEKCVHCGKCENVCPVTKKRETTFSQNVISAYSNTEETRLQGSSGGVFPELAYQIINLGGVVFGVSFDNERKQAIYCSSDEVSLEKLFKSKYVEAQDDNSYLQVRGLLDNGRLVLYCGTPCKIHGLFSYLGHDYPNLYTVDFMCHGKPSAGLLSDVIRNEEQLAGEKCVDVTFREKIKGWRNQMTAFYFLNINPSVYRSSDYYYYYFYLHNYSLRKSCIKCGYYNKHIADITMSDYWSIPKKEDDDKGVSLVFVNTEKGKTIIDYVHDKLSVQEQKSFIPSNMEAFAHSFRKGYSMQKRDRFFQMYNKNGISFVKNEGFNKILEKERKVQSIINKVLKIRGFLKNVVRHER